MDVEFGPVDAACADDDFVHAWVADHHSGDVVGRVGVREWVQACSSPNGALSRQASSTHRAPGCEPRISAVRPTTAPVPSRSKVVARPWFRIQPESRSTDGDVCNRRNGPSQYR